jgi:hypothetical protein
VLVIFLGWIWASGVSTDPMGEEGIGELRGMLCAGWIEVNFYRTIIIKIGARLGLLSRSA